MEPNQNYHPTHFAVRVEDSCQTTCDSFQIRKKPESSPSHNLRGGDILKFEPANQNYMNTTMRGISQKEPIVPNEVNLPLDRQETVIAQNSPLPVSSQQVPREITGGAFLMVPENPANPWYPGSIYYPVVGPLQETILANAFMRAGLYIPNYIQFDPKRDSAFFFGLTPEGNYVGKRAEFDGHIAVFGGSGTGKTTGIAKPTLKIWRGSIFAVDFKGDLIACGWERHPQVLYMIEGYNNSFYYDPFLLLKKEGEKRLPQNARALAQAIVPLSVEVKEPFWTQTTQAVLTGAIIYFFHQGLSFIEGMMEICRMSLFDLMDKIITDDLAAACSVPDIVYNDKVLASTSVDLRNHVMVFATDNLVKTVLSPVRDGSKMSLQWESLEHTDIFIRVDQSMIGQWGSMMRLMITQLITTMERRPEKYSPVGGSVSPTLLMLDEFPQYGRIDVLADALRVLRSKNVTFALFCQSLADLELIYGEKMSAAILDNCPFQAVLGAYDIKSQQYFSAKTGMVKTASNGVTMNYNVYGQPMGYGTTVQETIEPAIYPHEFGYIKDVILFHPDANGFCRLKKDLLFR